VQLAAQQGLGWHHRLVFGDQRRRRGAGEGVLNDFIVLRRTQQYADRWSLMWLLHVAVEGLNAEAQFSNVPRLESADLQLEGYQTRKSSVKEDEVDGEVTIAHLHRILGTDETKVAAKLGDEAAEVAQERTVEISFGVAIR